MFPMSEEPLQRLGPELLSSADLEEMIVYHCRAKMEQLTMLVAIRQNMCPVSCSKKRAESSRFFSESQDYILVLTAICAH